MSSGSSPLARGLQAPPRDPRPRGRIIPARAGFTGRRRPRPSARADHPRSRGVYNDDLVRHGVSGGSSPLARGLQLALQAEGRGLRIIPARAGFTTRSRLLCSMSRDHPRSRGVYSRATTVTSSPGGSSPLARGLLGGKLGGGGYVRIIPARAGFTPDGVRVLGADRDHPRSRGVYGFAPPLERIFRGSSPLARGLPGQVQAVEGAQGIIPARAGFTRRSGTAMSLSSDHPRSRGVYPGHAHRAQAVGGSSPLARGLLPLQPPLRELSRIIPARAGFTLSTATTWRSSRDHPRSRGVYWPPTTPSSNEAGSSPLARGLHAANPTLAEAWRIIPARAGFTSG